MKIKEIKALKYFIACALIATGFFAYSGVVGWKWFGGAEIETSSVEKDKNGVNRYYHK